jgi:para-nitrobenzyl esterase
MKALLVLCMGVTAVFGAIDQPVRIESGRVSGVPGVDAEVRVFRSIPFAAPPVGPLRWRPPQPVRHWDGVRKGDQFSSACPQPPRTGTSALLPTAYRLGPSNEDCLYLNVWTAAKSAADSLPVILYVPGGGFTTGAGSALVFDGESFAKRGVVLVTINYRLGALGFLAHPELTMESGRNASGNYGVMDQVAALQWVRQNIAGFGGDPKRVTLMGQSAGAATVYDLLAAPSAKGLFQRAIAESGGGPAAPYLDAPKLHEAEQSGLRFAEKLGGPNIARLRALPFDAFLASTGYSFTHIIDGSLLPADPTAIFRSGKQNDVPLLVGSNSNEGNNQARPVAAAKFMDLSRSRFGNAFDWFQKLYPAASEEQATASQVSETNDFYAWRPLALARLQASTGKSSAYLYYFERQPPPDAPIRGAYHTAELYYVFGNQQFYKQQWTDWDRKLSDMMMSYWVNFAANGDPNGSNLPRWTSFKQKESDRVMVFGDKVEMGSSRLAKPNRDFFDSYYANHVAK